VGLLIKFIVNVLALLVVSYLIPGFEFESMSATLVTAVVIGIVNISIKPLVQIITLPISVITLGITAFLINVAILYLISYFVPGFTIVSFVTAITASIVLSLVSWFLGKLATS